MPVASVAPAVLGYPQMKRYLIFFQNNTELRPTGGFLGTYALVTLGAADIKYLTVKDVYFLDGPNEKLKRPEPPAPLKRYLGVKQWYLRDANWSPDFAVAAPIMEKFFHEESVTVFGADKVPAIDGVIAITPRLAQDLLRLVGPVTVQGKTFTADNLVDELELQVEKQFYFENIPFEQRKDIVGVLTAAVLERLMALPLDRLLSLVSTLQAELAEGHILLWVKDAGLERLIVDRDWGGVLKPVRGDYFSVIDANLASLKSDPAVSRTVEYAIRPETDRSFIGTVRVTYNHEGRFDWKTTRYRTYTRLYVPAGTQLLGVAGAMLDDKLKDPRRTPGQADTYDELGRRAFGAFISIEPGEKRTLEFRFRLAPAVAEAIRGGQYFLDVEKQPGTEAVGLTLDLDFGKKPLKSEPPVTVSGNSDGHYRYRGDLRVDRAFDINF
ncbi:hypothetical protein A3C96_00910 [Candidatus Uhrbacteria bacterium RIFCSPHIGHO2_02_FULL_60_10]|uniref:DUF4012 domain-containing protein n=1 Tax=Candidatus Uhrbacteria bacterium RIFCSPHIGHO2_02_FULL_60_10 TaxID=1802392 RepID=A0A1F7U534_9BACT|nr:MAG: hypothetical protein A3C96_00910 [Candidatus Uhrbacteria bacterium RIFCSPHIGHO2_02_FULL_60_10]